MMFSFGFCNQIDQVLKQVFLIKLCTYVIYSDVSTIQIILSVSLGPKLITLSVFHCLAVLNTQIDCKTLDLKIFL
jgi:hypothetical protein